MATFFGEVVTGSYRYLDDEDEDALQDAVCRKISFSVNLEAEAGLLLVGEGPLAAAYAEVCFRSKPCGQLKAQSLNGNESVIGKLFRGQGWTAVTVDKELSRGELSTLAEQILRLADPAATSVLCLTARHISDYRGEDDSSDSLVRCLSTKQFPKQDHIKSLEIPNILTGLSAAILSSAAVKGVPASLVVNYVDVLSVDSLALQGFQKIHKLPLPKDSKLTKPNNLAEALKSLHMFSDSINLYM